MLSHYRFLKSHLEDFWKKVFGKSLSETGCAGIVSTHGDKVYQYHRTWYQRGLDVNVCSAIYLLTYTSELGETPKHESCQWVIDNYEKYRKMFDDDIFITREEFDAVLKYISELSNDLLIDTSVKMQAIIKNPNSTAITPVDRRKVTSKVTAIVSTSIEEMLSERGLYVSW